MRLTSQKYQETKSSIASKAVNGALKAKDAFSKGVDKAYNAPVDMAHATKRVVGDKVATFKNNYQDVKGLGGALKRTGQLGTQSLDSAYSKTANAVTKGASFVRDKASDKFNDLNTTRKLGAYDNKLNNIDYETVKLRQILENSSSSQSKQHNAEVRMRDLSAMRANIQALQNNLR